MIEFDADLGLGWMPATTGVICGEDISIQSTEEFICSILIRKWELITMS